MQEPATAKYDGMPSSAAMSGLATYVLPVEKNPEQLIAYVRTISDTGIPPVPPVPAEVSALRRITMLLRSKTGNDFSRYKQSTIRRRIERRMTVHDLTNMDAYARYLAENAPEVHILFKEMLINVTSFFRDREAFEALRHKALPLLFEHTPENSTFRIWVRDCASGEEAYSLAILFREYMDKTGQEFRPQIYATDIDDDAIETARAGLYPANISLDVPAERLMDHLHTDDREQQKRDHETVAGRKTGGADPGRPANKEYTGLEHAEKKVRLFGCAEETALGERADHKGDRKLGHRKADSKRGGVRRSLMSPVVPVLPAYPSSMLDLQASFPPSHNTR